MCSALAPSRAARATGRALRDGAGAAATLDEARARITTFNHGPGQNAWEEVADPEILDDGDVIVRVDAVTICGADLHILKGDMPAVRKGRILGYEAVETVWEAGGGHRPLRRPPSRQPSTSAPTSW
ncbi:MAG TPA: alcohol dehydrogenase catalytic domain-containing protein [Streptosporangiaceae bacterium]|nr:alcohol dehydrogenase catalytic domain-containing protein [Streptosporangiaceae bacterium]